jgi:hypothetical protein
MANEILRLMIKRVKHELNGSNLPNFQSARHAGFDSPRTLNDQILAQLPESGETKTAFAAIIE